MSGFVQQIAKSRRFHGQLSIDEFSSLIDQLADLDKASEATKKKGCFGVVLSVLFVPVGALGGLAIDLPVLAGIAAVLGLVGVIVSIVKIVSASKTDFEDRRYQLADRLTQLLQTDMPADATLDVGLDLAKPNARDKFVRKGKAGHWDVNFYEDSWLTLAGQFVDGTRFTVSMIEKHQDRSRWKRGRSGKMKHKSKTKTAALAVVSLKPKEKRYPNAGALGANARGAVQLPRLAEIKDLSRKENVLTLKVLLKTTWTVSNGVELITKMLLSLYQILNLAKHINKAQS